MAWTPPEVAAKANSWVPPEVANPPPEPTSPSVEEGEALGAGGEAALNIGTGLVAGYAGAWGAGARLAARGALAPGSDPTPDIEAGKAVQNFFTYQPRSEAGRAVAELPGKAIGALAKGITTPLGPDANIEETGDIGGMLHSIWQQLSPAAREGLKETGDKGAFLAQAIPGVGALAKLPEAVLARAVAREAAAAAASRAAEVAAAPKPGKFLPPVSGDSLRAQPNPIPRPNVGEPEPATVAAQKAPEPAQAPPAPLPGAGQRPPLRQGADPAQALFEQQAARDAGNAPAPAPSAGPPAERGSIFANRQAGAARIFHPPSEEGPQNAARATAAVIATRQGHLDDLDALAPGILKGDREGAVEGDWNKTGNEHATAKLQDAPGDYMRAQIASEHEALTSASQNVHDSIGAPTRNSVDKETLEHGGGIVRAAVHAIDDHMTDTANGMYTVARQHLGDSPMPLPDHVMSILNDPAHDVNPVAASLRGAARTKLQQLWQHGDEQMGVRTAPGSVGAAERFNEWLTKAKHNDSAGLIQQLKNANDLDVAAHISKNVPGQANLFQTARNVIKHRETMMEPDGVNALRKPKDRNHIDHEVPLDGVLDHVMGLPREQFDHFLNVLRSGAHLGNGELAPQMAEAIQTLQSHAIARIHNGGRAPGSTEWSALGAYKAANRISTHMPNLFRDRPDALANLQTINSAGNVLRMDRSYPGAVAQASKAGLLPRVAEKAIKGAKTMGEVGGVAHGNVLMAAGAHVLGKGLERGAEALSARARLAAAKKSVRERGSIPLVNEDTGGRSLEDLALAKIKYNNKQVQPAYADMASALKPNWSMDEATHQLKNEVTNTRGHVHPDVVKQLGNSTHSALDTMLDAGKKAGLSDDHELMLTLQALRDHGADFPVSWEANLKHPYNGRPLGEATGGYHASGRIGIRTGDRSLPELIQNFVHENTHAATIAELQRNPTGQLANRITALMNEGRAGFAKEHGAYNSAQHFAYLDTVSGNRPGRMPAWTREQLQKGNTEMWDHSYGLSNPKEFVAEAMANPSFRAKLDEWGQGRAEGAPHNVGKPPGIFQRLITTISNFFGKGEPKVSGLLHDTLNATGQLMEAQRAMGATPYRRELSWSRNPERGSMPIVNEPDEHGPMINIGMHRVDQNRVMSEPEIISALQSRGVNYKNVSFRNEGAEPTAVVSLHKPMGSTQGNLLADDLGQSAIAQRTGPGTGNMLGKGAKSDLAKQQGWDRYNSNEFRMHDGRTEGEHLADTSFNPEELEGRSKQTVKNPIRNAYPGIYDDPKDIMARVKTEAEDPIMQQLFNKTRQQLHDDALAHANVEQDYKPPGIGAKAKGSAAAKNVMTDENAERLRNTINAFKSAHPEAYHGMVGWYEMQALYDKVVEHVGEKAAPAVYSRLNHLMGMSSPGSDVLTEINRGTAANMMAEQGKFAKFEKYGGISEEKRGRNFPPELEAVKGHAYHSTAQAGPMADYLKSGSIQMESPKVPTYIRSSAAQGQGFQNRVLVGDAHWSRGVGLSDVRTAQEYINKRTGQMVKPYNKSVSNPELHDLHPWYRSEVADKVGLPATSAQAVQWGALSAETGVDTAIGAPKLELFAKQVKVAADRLGISPEEALKLIIKGQAHAG